MKKIQLFIYLLLVIIIASCRNKVQENKNIEMKHEKGSFGYDLDFLRTKDSVIVLRNEDAYVIISPKYQGKVFTSSAEGLSGKSFGWINYDAFDKAQDPHVNAFGGENRLWLGPEGGKFSLFFKPGSEMIFENWVTPSAIDIENWDVIAANEKKASLSKEASLTNYAGSEFQLKINRVISILSNKEIEEIMGMEVGEKVKSVGYKTENSITNLGEEAWTRETGAPCIWILDMFTPSDSTVILVPYKEDVSGKIATTDYFGEISADRIKIGNGLVKFKADGKSRGKIGIPPHRAKPVAGSYDKSNGILTVTYFDIDPNAVYLNQEWTTDKDPFSGDAVNAYNDGLLEDGSQMGPFYEIESASPAAFLQPGQKLEHMHTVIHLAGDNDTLEELIKQVFNINEVSIDLR